jgi:hypothetical protein
MFTLSTNLPNYLFLLVVIEEVERVVSIPTPVVFNLNRPTRYDVTTHDVIGRVSSEASDRNVVMSRL